MDAGTLIRCSDARRLLRLWYSVEMSVSRRDTCGGAIKSGWEYSNKIQRRIILQIVNGKLNSNHIAIDDIMALDTNMPYAVHVN